MAVSGAGLGNFDGLHRGHMKIIERIRRGATERGGTAVVLTFEPASAAGAAARQGAAAADDASRRSCDALERAGVQGVAVVRFTQELSQWEPEAFVRRVLVDWLRVAEVWVGADFLFGRDRSGNFSLLRTLGQQFGFRVEKIDPIRYKDFVVSSTRIRRLVSEGRVEEAGALLGRHYAIEGEVVEGARRGREMGFPTANLATENELLPPNGVYATFSSRSTGDREAERDEHRRPSHLRGAADHERRDARPRFLGRSLRAAAGSWPSSSGCGTSGGSPTWTPCASRLRPTSAGRAIIR